MFLSPLHIPKKKEKLITKTGDTVNNFPGEKFPGIFQFPSSFHRYHVLPNNQLHPKSKPLNPISARFWVPRHVHAIPATEICHQLHPTNTNRLATVTDDTTSSYCMLHNSVYFRSSAKKTKQKKPGTSYETFLMKMRTYLQN